MLLKAREVPIKAGCQKNIKLYGLTPPFIRQRQKSRVCILREKAARLSAWDPWFSVPTLRWVWLDESVYYGVFSGRWRAVARCVSDGDVGAYSGRDKAGM